MLAVTPFGAGLAVAAAGARLRTTTAETACLAVAAVRERPILVRLRVATAFMAATAGIPTQPVQRPAVVVAGTLPALMAALK